MRKIEHSVQRLVEDGWTIHVYLGDSPGQFEAQATLGLGGPDIIPNLSTCPGTGRILAPYKTIIRECLRKYARGETIEEAINNLAMASSRADSSDMNYG